MTRTSQKKFHIIYKITRFDGAYYIGMHSTDNLSDGYFGSGQRLWHSIKKYGKDKHLFEVIEYLPSRKAVCQREAEIVNKELMSDPLCMNLREGGSYEYRKPDKAESNKNKSIALKKFYASEAGQQAKKFLSDLHTGRKATEEASKNMSVAATERIVKQKENGQWEEIQRKNAIAHTGKVQSAEHIQKKNDSMQAYKDANGGKRTFSPEACENIAEAQRGNEKHAKLWVLTDTQGTSFTIKNLNKWLRETGLVTNRDSTGIRERAKPGISKPLIYRLEKA